MDNTFGELVLAIFGVLLLLVFIIVPERVREYFLRGIYAVKGYKKIIFLISWLILAGVLFLLALTSVGLFDELMDIGFDAIFEFLHIR